MEEVTWHFFHFFFRCSSHVVRPQWRLCYGCVRLHVWLRRSRTVAKASCWQVCASLRVLLRCVIWTLLSRMLLWPGGTGGTKAREMNAHATLYAMYRATDMATDEGISAGNFALFGGIMCHRRAKPLCFKICTMNALQFRDSRGVFLLLTADGALAARRTVFKNPSLRILCSVTTCFCAY